MIYQQWYRAIAGVLFTRNSTSFLENDTLAIFFFEFTVLHKPGLSWAIQGLVAFLILFS